MGQALIANGFQPLGIGRAIQGVLAHLILAAALSLALPFLFASPAFAGGVGEYVVRPGDSLYGISARYEVT